MFCSKCGSKSIEGSAFCQKCGAKLITDNTSQQTATSVAVNPIQPQAHDTQADKPKKKKSKLLPIILGAVALVIVVIIIAASLGDKTDYVMTVKAHSPFVSQGYSYTYGTVLNDYIDSPIWEVSKANDKIYVNVRGKNKDTGDNILVSILVAIGANDQAVITPASVAIGSDRIEGQDNVVRFLLDLFMAYDGGQSGTSQKSGDTSYTTYTSEDHDFSFQYPSYWIDGGSQTVTEIIRVYDGNGASFSVSEVYVLPFELGTGDEALIKAAINDNGIVPYKFVSVDDIGVNGKVMRELVYTSEDAVHGLLYVSNYFYFVEDRDYQIKIELPADTFDNYQTVYETMMNSYTITDTSGGSALPPSNHDDAYNIAQAWLAAHPDIENLFVDDNSNELTVDSDEYYGFHVTDYWDDGVNEGSTLVTVILISKSTGKLFSYNGYTDEIMPLDDWYTQNFGTSQSSSQDEILYDGEPIMNWMGARLADLRDVFGDPDIEGTVAEGGAYGYAYGSYDIAFVKVSNGDYIENIYGRPTALTANGATLDTNRDELVSLLGNPAYEDWGDNYGTDAYYMEFIYQGTYSISFTLDDPSGKAYEFRISHSSYGSGDAYSEEYNSSSDPVTADGSVLSVGSLVYAKQSVNYVRGYVTSIDSANSVNVAWDTVLENNLWGFTECAIFSDSYSISGYSYSASSTGTTVQLVGLKFNLSANELYSRMP